jgi:class 3 adenylate cyclase
MKSCPFIGDCYLAVVGLPTPQKYHASIMAKFASDCRSKLNILVTELELTLGDGTSDLKLRIGLHSGPVTAGVLRGQKARFQLFGDTVNTAARMESNGIPNKIHVSEATANELIATNKAAWLIKREDMITAKGKGQMVTYWVEPKIGANSTLTTGTRNVDLPLTEASILNEGNTRIMRQ